MWCMAQLVTWLHLRTHHLWRTIKEVGLLSEDHLPQSMTQPVQLLAQLKDTPPFVPKNLVQNPAMLWTSTLVLGS